MQQKGRFSGKILLLILILIILVLVSTVIGRYHMSPADVAEILREYVKGAEYSDPGAASVLLTSRLPRIAAAVLIGCALSVSGASYQGMFKNPMVSPDLLGASAGAGFGAALGLLLELPMVWVQLLAFGFGLLAVMIACLISRFVGGRMESSPVLLVLSGIVVGALFQAFISIVKYVADPFDVMPTISFWLMGGLTYVTGDNVKFLLIPVLGGTVVLFLLRWKINLLSFGSEEANAMGVPVKLYQSILIICATFMTAASVAVGGMIGWAGLIVPHFARMLVGPDYRRMLPCAAILGGAFLLLVDDAARCIAAQELPIGILTAIIGAPVFVSLLAKGRKGFLT